VIRRGASSGHHARHGRHDDERYGSIPFRRSGRNDESSVAVSARRRRIVCRGKAGQTGSQAHCLFAQRRTPARRAACCRLARRQNGSRIRRMRQIAPRSTFGPLRSAQRERCRCPPTAAPSPCGHETARRSNRGNQTILAASIDVGPSACLVTIKAANEVHDHARPCRWVPFSFDTAASTLQAPVRNRRDCRRNLVSPAVSRKRANRWSTR
jgi:hypothetical protein